VGGAAQTKAMKKVAGKLRLELAQYRELASFAQFGAADLDKATRAQLERGQRSTRILTQPQYSPLPLEKEIITLYAITSGYVDDVPVSNVMAFENDLQQFMETSHPEIGKSIAATKDLAPETEEALKKAILDFKQGWKC
jgi:F-type H+-transporting ATPase subunit alpha